MPSMVSLLFVGALGVFLFLFIFSPFETEDLDLTMVNVSGGVETVGFSTDPFKLEFTKKSSDQPITILLDDNYQYSVSLFTGTYDVKVFYTTIGDTTTFDCDAGTHDIDSDIDNLDFKC